MTRRQVNEIEDDTEEASLVVSYDVQTYNITRTNFFPIRIFNLNTCTLYIIMYPNIVK